MKKPAWQWSKTEMDAAYLGLANYRWGKVIACIERTFDGRWAVYVARFRTGGRIEGSYVVMDEIEKAKTWAEWIA